jgi:hypothetical protein
VLAITFNVCKGWHRRFNSVPGHHNLTDVNGDGIPDLIQTSTIYGSQSSEGAVLVSLGPGNVGPMNPPKSSLEFP